MLGSPPSRFKLRAELCEHQDYLAILPAEWNNIKECYGGLEIELW